MTKKHYIVIANALRNIRVLASQMPIQDGQATFNAIVNELCFELNRDNPRFNVAKFKQAINSNDN